MTSKPTVGACRLSQSAYEFELGEAQTSQRAGLIYLAALIALALVGVTLRVVF